MGDLKAELRKAMSEVKNVERRISAGGLGAGRRSLGGRGAFGFKAKGGDGGGALAPGKGPPHTPSKKLSDAKNRLVNFSRFVHGHGHDRVCHIYFFFAEFRAFERANGRQSCAYRWHVGC